MDLTLTEKHRALRDEANAFIARHRDRAPQLGGGRKRPDRKVLEWQALLLESGYFARNIPRDYGGFGAPHDVIEMAIIADAFSRSGVSPGIHNQGISMLVPTLLEVGTEEQKRRWVGPTIRGEVIWCQGYSEPGAGSDLASVKTSAVRGRDAEGTLERHRDVRGQRHVVINQLVDVLDAQVGAGGEVGLRHSAGFELLGEDLAGGDRPIGCKCGGGLFVVDDGFHFFL